jgi:hypothetical protein
MLAVKQLFLSDIGHKWFEIQSNGEPLHGYRSEGSPSFTPRRRLTANTTLARATTGSISEYGKYLETLQGLKTKRIYDGRLGDLCAAFWVGMTDNYTIIQSGSVLIWN